MQRDGPALKSNKGSAGQQRFEREWLNKKMTGFNPVESGAWKYLTTRFGNKISKEELLSLGLIISHELDIELTREYKRRKETMIKWFDERMPQIEPFMDGHVEIINSKNEVLGDAHSESSNNPDDHEPILNPFELRIEAMSDQDDTDWTQAE